MKILLDENLAVDLRHFLAEHQTFTVVFMGWKGLRNGELMARAAQDGFDVLVTRDTGFEHQQNPMSLPLTVVILPAYAEKLDDLLPLVPRLLTTILLATPRALTKLLD